MTSLPRAALAVAIALSTACKVSDFDKLERGSGEQEAGSPAPPDAGAPGREDGGMSGEAGPAPTLMEAGMHMDASGDAAFTVDASDAEIPREAATDAMGPLLDDAGCPLAEDGGPGAAPFRGVGPFVERARVRSGAAQSHTIGPSFWQRGRRLWMLSSSWLPLPADAPEGTPANYPLGGREGNEPWLADAGSGEFILEPPLDSSGVAVPLVLLGEGEPAGFTLLTPTSVLGVGDGTGAGLVVGIRAIFGQDEERAVWLADLAPESATAVRRPGFLFKAPDPTFATGGHRGTEYVYLYACEREPNGVVYRGFCKVARAPRDLADQRAAYEALVERPDGQRVWSSDLSAATRVIEDVDAELSISFNRYLRKFVAVHSASLRSEIVLQLGDTPAGPWTRVASLPVAQGPTPWASGYAREHTAVERKCGAELVVTYFMPTTVKPDGFVLEGEAVIGTVALH